MKSIKLNPDNKIIFKINNELICIASKEEAETILGKTLDALPGGASYCEHYPDENRFAYFTDNSQLDISIPWADGLLLLEKEADLIALGQAHAAAIA